MKNFKRQSGILLLLITGFLCSASAQVIILDATGLNSIPVQEIVLPSSIEEISNLVSRHLGPISIAGGRYSQGGQIATQNCLVLDMKKLDRIINIDLAKRQITVEAGIVWRKIQEAIDPKGLSLRIMQSFSNFTVGGSLSVNAHGRYVNEGPIIRSVASIKLVLADGSVREASPYNNSELFFAAIGGYGGIGVIVEATLNLEDNTPLERVSKRMKISEYKKYFFENISQSKTAVFHNGDIYPTKYQDLNLITWYVSDKIPTNDKKLSPQNQLSKFQQFLLARLADSVLGQYYRQHIYDPYKYSKNKIRWRNYEASSDVSILEPASNSESTYVLQEYFIPVGRFENFVSKMGSILKQHRVNVINVSVRHSLPDIGSLLAWAQEEVFAFVIFYKQGLSDADRQHAHLWASKLIDASLEEGGTYYLPYQIVASKTQFCKAYPRAKEYFALKKTVDPTYKFRNKLWDCYYH
jgi:FAD binding domain